MGHSRIGTLPRTRWWRDVVDFIAGGADVAQVAEKTLWAAQKALSLTKNDVGFREAVHLMVQLALAGRKGDAAEHLAAVGLDLKGGYSAADVATAVSSELDRRMEGKGRRSDWGEMARGALVSLVAEELGSKPGRLFDATREDLTADLRRLHREPEFGTFGRKFCAALTTKFLNYFLSKTLATHVGEGRRFATMNEYATFKRAMHQHCEEASAIVEKYCGQWLQKQIRTKDGNVSREDTERFGAYGIVKMQLELAVRGGRNGN